VRTLVVNAGSSSLKLRRLDGEAEAGGEDLPGGEPDREALRAAIDRLGEVDVVAHRIVHGGERFREAVWIDEAVRAALGDLVDLAPLHQPKSLAALDAVAKVLPDVRAAACFDTAFHATLPPEATTYALPRVLRERYGLRRYGFHGLSHAYASRRATELGAGRRIVTCHLGAGASLAAVRDGRSIDTTMGFTPLEGLVMATRSGSVDPGMLLWLLEREELSPRELSDALEHDSGILGLSGTKDMRELLARDDDDARLTVGVYVHRLRAGIGAMAATLGGVDALVFTGGVGENAAPIRTAAADGFVSPEHVYVIEAREDLEMVRQLLDLAGGRGERSHPRL
jgi:acetate kinase